MILPDTGQNHLGNLAESHRFPRLDDREDASEGMGHHGRPLGVPEPISLEGAHARRSAPGRVVREPSRTQERVVVGDPIRICLKIDRNSSRVEKIVRNLHTALPFL
jgi:hypothetical protein